MLSSNLNVPKTNFSSVLDKLEKCLKGRIVLLGVGNTLRGDDAFGALLAERINRKVNFTAINSGVVPENYLGKVIKERPDTVLLADAVDFGGKPGDADLLDMETVRTGNFFLTHNASVNLLFEFIKAQIQCRAYLLAVQPVDIGLDRPLSPEVGNCLNVLSLWFLTKYDGGIEKDQGSKQERG